MLFYELNLLSGYLLLLMWPLIRGKSKARFNEIQEREIGTILFNKCNGNSRLHSEKVKRKSWLGNIGLCLSFVFSPFLLFQTKMFRRKPLIRLEPTPKVANHLLRQAIFHESLKLFEISIRRVCFVDQRKVVQNFHERKAAAKYSFLSDLWKH